MNKKQLHNNNNQGFKTPDNYFDNFEHRLFGNVGASELQKESQVSGFTVPDNYFENLESVVVHQNINKQTKVISIFKNYWPQSSVAVAASIALILFLIFNKSENLTFNTLEVASIENYILNTDVTASDIAQYLTDDDFDNSLTDNAIFTEDYLENYLLNNSNIEYLLIE
jgi:hypothetical protein